MFFGKLDLGLATAATLGVVQNFFENGSFGPKQLQGSVLL